MNAKILPLVITMPDQTCSADIKLKLNKQLQKYATVLCQWN